MVSICQVTLDCQGKRRPGDVAYRPRQDNKYVSKPISCGEKQLKKPASAGRAVVAAAAAVSALADALVAALVTLVALVVPGALAAEAVAEEIGRPEQRIAQDKREKGLMK